MRAFPIDEDTIIGDILDAAPASEAAFLSFGLGCIGCPAARGETVREACDVHEIDANALLEKLRRACAE